MTLAQFTIELKRTNELLERQASALERLAVCAERYLGPLPTSAPYCADLKDLHIASPAAAESIRRAEDEFAASAAASPRSDYFYAMIKQFEDQVKDAYGEDAVKELPWNKPEATR